ncbi:unnamed protein product [Sphagnum balticum]
MTLLTMAVAVVFATTYYQTYLLSSLLISYDEPAMTFDQLIGKLEARQMKAMFWEPAAELELEMRQLSTFDRFTRTLVNNPPVYRTRLNTSVLKVLRDEPVITLEQDTDLVDIITNDIPSAILLKCGNHSH